ncbi:unnamed protein product [Ixodes pacificus]
MKDVATVEAAASASHAIPAIEDAPQQDATFPGEERLGLVGRARRLSCPPEGPVSQGLSWLLLLVLAWGTLWGLFGDGALPGGHFFSPLALVCAAYAGGQLVKLVRLPPLLGMLITGFILRNVDAINVVRHIDPSWASDLRSMALILILIRAGLGLDATVLRNLGGACLRLTCCPCLVECAAVAVSAKLLLGFPWLWGTLLGFVLGAVSPAVVVPSMLWLQCEGLGVDQGIPTLVMAAASFDDVLAITGFGVVLGIVFSKGNLAWNIAKGPLEAVVGLVFGGVVGGLLWFLPSAQSGQRTTLRPVLLLLAGLCVMFAARRVEFGGSGPLGCIAVAFVAAFRWNKDQHGAASASKTCALLWEVFQPILFGLIGSEVQIKDVASDATLLGLGVLGTSLTLRMTTSFLVVYGASLSLKERLFVAIAWLPKATVQAAIGPVALDYARNLGADDRTVSLATQVLTVAVLSILVTAPIGAAAIALSAPRLLRRSAKSLDPANGRAVTEPDEADVNMSVL